MDYSAYDIVVATVVVVVMIVRWWYSGCIVAVYRCGCIVVAWVKHPTIWENCLLSVNIDGLDGIKPI